MMNYKVTIIVAIVIVIIVVIATVAFWMLWRVPQNCESCRIKPVCESQNKGQCEDSYNVLVKVDRIMQECNNKYIEKFGGSKSKYMLKEHPDKSFSFMKRSIYLKIRKEDGSFYDDQTLIYVGLHELAHTVCGKLDGDAHGPEFQLVFGRLLDIGIELNYFDPKSKMDDSYPHT